MTTPEDTELRGSYAQLFCDECEESWDISFSNKTYPPVEYVMYIEQKINDGCPDCGNKLILLGDKS